MGFFKNLKKDMEAKKKLVDMINNGDIVVDRKNKTVTTVEQNQNGEENKTEDNENEKQ